MIVMIVVVKVVVVVVIVIIVVQVVVVVVIVVVQVVVVDSNSRATHLALKRGFTSTNLSKELRTLITTSPMLPSTALFFRKVPTRSSTCFASFE